MKSNVFHLLSETVNMAFFLGINCHKNGMLLSAVKNDIEFLQIKNMAFYIFKAKYIFETLSVGESHVMHVNHFMMTSGNCRRNINK